MTDTFDKAGPAFSGGSYTIIAWANHQTPLLYHTFGSYQGEWMMLAKDDSGTYYVYKDSYGSCSGCDAYEAKFGYREEATRAAAEEFAKDYKSFIEIPPETARRLVENGRLETVFPANIRDTYSDVDVPMFAGEATLAIRLDLGMPIALADFMDAKNQELKQRALKAFGYERFASEAGMEEIDRDGEDALLKKGDVVMAYVKDASTPRRYLLRVPPTMTKIKEAVAWTFGMTVENYRPLIET